MGEWKKCSVLQYTTFSVSEVAQEPFNVGIYNASFFKNVRVTITRWDPAVKAPVDLSGLQFIGGYQGLAAANSFVHPFCNDTRVGIQDIFTTAIPSAQPGAD